MLLKIQIIVHSATGHTLEIADEIHMRLKSLGHQVVFSRIVAKNDREGNYTRIVLIQCPPIEAVDGYIIASPVRAFSLSPVIKAYLTTIKSFNKRPVFVFVTEFFPFKWMGGNQAIRQLKSLVEQKHGQVFDTSIINWSNSNRKLMIKETIKKAEL